MLAMGVVWKAKREQVVSIREKGQHSLFSSYCSCRGRGGGKIPGWYSVFYSNPDSAVYWIWDKEVIESLWISSSSVMLTYRVIIGLNETVYLVSKCSYRLHCDWQGDAYTMYVQNCKIYIILRQLLKSFGFQSKVAELHRYICKRKSIKLNTYKLYTF